MRRTTIMLILGSVLLFMLGYSMGKFKPSVAYAQAPTHGGIPKAYGHLVAAVVNSDGTGLVFEDSDGVIRFVTITGQLEGELTRH